MSYNVLIWRPVPECFCSCRATNSWHAAAHPPEANHTCTATAIFSFCTGTRLLDAYMYMLMYTCYHRHLAARAVHAHSATCNKADRPASSSGTTAGLGPKLEHVTLHQGGCTERECISAPRSPYYMYPFYLYICKLLYGRNGLSSRVGSKSMQGS